MAARCPGDLAGMRDHALLLLAASGLDRAAIVGLDVEHIRFAATAAELSPVRGGPAVVVRRGANRSVCFCTDLELAAQDDVALGQADFLTSIHL